MANSTTIVQPMLSASWRWAVRGLAWLAFAISAYLAVKSLGHVPSAGCIAGGPDCDIVQSSSWSVWLGVPVALLGLACYATLATLSVLMGIVNARWARWVGTLLLTFSLLAALAGLWFTAIQLFVLTKICIECMAVHLCGISIAAILLWDMWARKGPAAPLRIMPAGAPPLRAAIAGRPTTAIPIPSATQRLRATGRPSLALAAGGAVALTTGLVAGQVLFPADTSYQGKVALKEAIHLGNSPTEQMGSGAASDPKRHQANRITTEIPDDADAVVPATAVEDAQNDHASTSKTGADNTGAARAESPTGSEVVPATMAETPKRSRVVTLLDNLTFDLYELPVLGSREAPHVIVEFFSYDCAHCHRMHRILQRALDRYGDQLAVVTLVVPFGAECNKEVKRENSVPGSCLIARMSLAVASLDPNQYSRFHAWLMGGEKPPAQSEVMGRAYKTLGRDRVRALSHEAQYKQIGQFVEVYEKIRQEQGGEAEKIGLPLLIIGDEVLSGDNEDKFLKALETHFGVKPTLGSDAAAD